MKICLLVLIKIPLGCAIGGSEGLTWGPVNFWPISWALCYWHNIISYASSSLALQPVVDLGLLYSFSPSIPILCCCLPISAPKPYCIFLHSIYPSEFWTAPSSLPSRITGYNFFLVARCHIISHAQYTNIKILIHTHTYIHFACSYLQTPKLKWKRNTVCWCEPLY
jgi:hypothetical protein